MPSTNNNSDPVADAVRDLASQWNLKAASRRAVSQSDPAADALQFCAGEALALLKQLEEKGENRLTVEQFAKLVHVDVTPQTVRSWIRSGRLQAIETAKGYRIAADAKVPPRVEK